MDVAVRVAQKLRADYVQQPAKVPGPSPPAPQNQWGARAPGTGIVPFNKDLDHNE
ncbi:hypothetical protein FRC12_022034 [Ceratobasidium sp. 428]|nr:hypothetical protein FRC12_022034 [Ceratobasidium sp. 428]